MSETPNELKNAMVDLDKGLKPRATVRELLSWFGAARRRYRVVARIRAALDDVGLITYPDFEGEWVDSTIYFMKKPKPEPAKAGTDKTGAGSKTDSGQSDALEPVATVVVEPQAGKTSPDGPVTPSHRLGRLKAAHVKVVSVAPTASIQQAITIMLTNDFSQLPVMTNERDVKGLISWKSIGSRLALKKKCELVKDAMEPWREMSEDGSIFDAVSVIAKDDCVLVRSQDKRVTGVITASDIANQFHLLTEPFLLLSDVEGRVRNLIASKIKPEDLKKNKDPSDPTRTIESIHDFTFGGYVFLLQQSAIWDKLCLCIDQKTFVKQLDEVREVRNDVMHFDPDGIDEDAQQSLRTFAGFMERLAILSAG